MIMSSTFNAKKERNFMSAQNINSLISEFDQEALAAKERLTSVLTMISNGMVPSKEEMTRKMK
jgi:hypothetical protein